MPKSSKIKSITVVCRQGVSTHEIGSTYNGLLLDNIKDKCMEFPDSFESLYMGFTKDGATVFEVINAPIEVEYTLVGDK